MNELEFISDLLNEAKVDKNYIDHLEKHVLCYNYEEPIVYKILVVSDILGLFHEHIFYAVQGDEESYPYAFDFINDNLKVKITIDDNNNFSIIPVIAKDNFSFKEDFRAIFAYYFVTSLNKVNVQDIWLCENCGRICFPGIHIRDNKYCCPLCKDDHVGDR